MASCNIVQSVAALCILQVLWCTVGCAAETPRSPECELKSPALAVSIAGGRVSAIENRLTHETYQVTQDGGLIETDRGAVDLRVLHMTPTAKTKSRCEFRASSLGLEVTRSYAIRANRVYFDRSLAIRNISDRPILVKNVSDCVLRFAAPFVSTAFHDDNLERNDPMSYTYMERASPVVYKTSVNVFMRTDKGGLYAGLKYPYFRPTPSGDSVSLSYEANHRLQPGEMLELPTMFCGVYEKTGYTCRKELSWTPRILSTAQEEMDLGEVRAMQAVMRDYLPKEPCPRPGYFIWLNSYWVYDESLGGEGMSKLDAARVRSYCNLADLVKKSRCIDLMCIAHVWCGWARYLEPCIEIDAVGDDALFPHNPAIDALYAYAKSIGLPVHSFCEPTALVRNYRADRPDWRIRPSADSPNTLAQKCHANPAYEDWLYRLLCNTIDTCHLSGWSWDHQWMRKPMVCYDASHGHEPGNCEFAQYRNITNLILRLRQRYPNTFMEVYWGLKEAGPWALKGLNSTENAYENVPCPALPGYTAADDMRFQHWFNHNYRFLPTYMNMAQINFAREGNGHLYSLLSCLNASTHAALCNWIPFATDAEADKIFARMRYWKKWASAHLAYLDDRIDLFGMPCRTGGIDGTAHIIGSRGYIFVFNPTSGVCHGSVPLTEMIGLTGGSKYSVDEISTGKALRLGVYERAGDMRFEIQPKTALLFELKPSRAAVSRAVIPSDAIVQPAFRRAPEVDVTN